MEDRASEETRYNVGFIVFVMVFVAGAGVGGIIVATAIALARQGVL